MNLEIKQKYDNFIKIIENKEWLEQQHDKKYISNLLIYNENMDLINSTDNNQINNECKCEISSGYISFLSNNSKDLSNNSDIISNNSLNKNQINYLNNKIDYKDELSLLEDNFIINNNKIEEISDKTIKSEFKNLFNYNENLSEIKKSDNTTINNKLEKIFANTLLKKNIHLNNKKINKNIINKNIYDLNNYINNEEYITTENLLKNLSKFIEKNLFEESTIGWNNEFNIYIINQDKLINNLKKIIFTKKYEIKLGFIFRDYTNTKVYNETDFTKYWIGYENMSNMNDIKLINYSIDNKVLYYCLKNLLIKSKFKKKIGKTYYKFIKKTVQNNKNTNIIIDLIFYVGIKNT